MSATGVFSIYYYVCNVHTILGPVVVVPESAGDARKIKDRTAVAVALSCIYVIIIVVIIIAYCPSVSYAYYTRNVRYTGRTKRAATGKRVGISRDQYGQRTPRK